MVDQQRRSWIISLILHVSLLLLLAFSFVPVNYVERKASSVQPIAVHAVSAQQVKQQQQAIAKKKAAKLAAIRRKQEKIRQQKLARARAKAKAARIAEQKRQAKILAHKKAVAAAKAKRLAQQKAAIQAKKLAQQKAVAAAKAKAKAAKQAALAKKTQELLNKLNAQQMQKDSTQVNKVITAHNNAVIDKYKAQIKNKIAQNWLIPNQADKKLSSKFRIRLAPGGVVLSVTLVKSSGVEALDLSAKTAIIKSSPLPVPKDSGLFDNFRVLSLTVRPQSILQG